MKNNTPTTSRDELRTLDDILSQAFTDGASDTMWANDRHVEIFATAKRELEALFQTAQNQLLDELLAEMPEKISEYDQDTPYTVIATHNCIVDQLTKLIESKRGK